MKMKNLIDYRAYLNVEIKHANVRNTVDYALYVNVLSGEMVVTGLKTTGAVLEQCNYVPVVSSIKWRDVEGLIDRAQALVDKYRSDFVCEAIGLYLSYADAKRAFMAHRLLADDLREYAETYYRYCVSKRIDGMAFRAHAKSLRRQLEGGNESVFGNRELASIYEACCLDV